MEHMERDLRALKPALKLATLAIAVTTLAAFFVAGVAPADKGPVLISVCNVALMALAVAAIWPKGWVDRSIILSFAIPTAVFWPLPTIYFALWNPTATYSTGLGEVGFLDGALRYQTALLCFVAPYSAVLWARRSRAIRHQVSLLSVQDLSRVAFVGSAAAVLGLLTLTGSLGGLWRTLAAGILNYGVGLVLAGGLAWPLLAAKRRALLIVILLASGEIYTVANTRVYALEPLLALGIGYLSSETVHGRSKLIAISMGVMVLPIYLLVGNQTRLALGELGLSNFDERVDIMNGALAGDLSYTHGNVAADAMARIFSPGGHARINDDSPEDFDLAEYLGETITYALPQYLVGRSEGLKYLDNNELNRYGFTVTESSSVEMSLVGSLFRHGGFAGAAIGGALLALIHRVLIRLVMAGKPLWRVAVTGSLAIANLSAYTLDLGVLVRAYLWTLIYISFVALAIHILHLLFRGPLRSRAMAAP